MRRALAAMLAVALAVAVLSGACGPHRAPLVPPEPGAVPAPVELGWPDAGAPPSDALVGP